MSNVNEKDNIYFDDNLCDDLGDKQQYKENIYTEKSDYIMMGDQVKKLISENDDFTMDFENYQTVVDDSLEHYSVIKPHVMLQVAQKTIKNVLDRDITCDDLNLDLEYLMNREIFGINYNDEDDDYDTDEDEDDTDVDDDGGLLDELNEDDDDVYD